jgi:ADP-ribosyltransferase exoenzyme
MSITIALPIGFKPVIKHGDHDQSEHGNWATGAVDDLVTLGAFDEETQYESALNTYSERYGVDKEGNIVGVTRDEHNAIDDYSQNGYKRINEYLRADKPEQKTELDIAEAKAIIENNPVMYARAVTDYSDNNEVGEQLTESELEDAVYQYAMNNSREVLDAYNSGNTPMAEQTKKEVSYLDSLIDKAPVLFGGSTLYRVFSDRVLDGLKEGDIMRDKGFLSTTRIDVTREQHGDARTWMGGIKETPDTVGIILPNENKNGKGIAVDIYRTVVNDTSSVADTEKEVLLPRDTPLKFLGYKTDVGTEARVAVFQRVDK